MTAAQTTEPAAPARKLEPGSTGWTCADLDAPEFRDQWEREHIQLAHGVIAQMPAMHFAHGQPVHKLGYLIQRYLDERGIKDAQIGVGEVDLQVSPTTRYRVDGLVLMPDDIERQRRNAAELRPGHHPMGVIITPPTVVFESISLGHEAHDEIDKREDYARFGIPNYWLVNAYRKSLRCLRLENGSYVSDSVGEGPDAVVTPSVFSGLKLPLSKVFM